MRIGLQVSNFTWPDGTPRLGSQLRDVVRTAEQAGFASFSVMDHFFQIRLVGPPEMDMLESYTTLAFAAGCTERISLGTLVTGVHYRHPGLLVKTVTTLDVLSGGRAFLGIGAGWNEAESRGLGVPFPSMAERFEKLDETLRICHQMWRGDETAFHGNHYQLDRPLNVPQSLSRPHPPILIGGSGERKTLRLVARYADACNLFPTPEISHKLDVLREHCAVEGREYDSIDKTSMLDLDLGPTGEGVDEALGSLRWLAGMGITTVHVGLKNVQTLRPLEVMAERVIPVVATWGATAAALA
jgi:F420-dependent oxidoreductase-like protein